MSYSGNPSLSSDVKERILSTFDQTLELAREGSRQEALLGCDFVLRMDPQFQPALVLQERLRSSAGPVPVDDLRIVQGTDTPEDPFGELESLGFELPDLVPGEGASPPGDDLKGLFDQRRYQELMAKAERNLDAIGSDPGLQRMLVLAQERMEAEPYLLKFLTAARQALQLGQDDEVGRLLDKARSLDPGHPGIAELERMQAASAPAASPSVAVPGLDLPSALSAMPGGLSFGGGDSESERRIQELLREGQAALDAGDPQGAIDAWSRIFLIDIDHQEASRRIETARKVKAEAEREVEEIFHDGVARLEAGETAAARQAFERVLEIQPSYFAAREYLQQLDAGTVPVHPKTAAHRDMAAAAEAVMPLPAVLDVPRKDLKEEILVPPEPGERPSPARAPKKKTVAARDTGRARRLFFLVGGAVLVLALAGGWFFLQNREQLFPNSQEQVAAPTLPQDPIARAQRLHNSGKTAIALNQLRRLPPSDPHYRQAQKLIAEWTGTAAAAEATPADPDAASTAAPQDLPVPILSDSERRRQLLLAAARQAYGEQTYVKALRRLEQAGTIAKLEGEDARLLADTKQKLEPVAKQLAMFREHEWEYVLPDLWRLHEADPGDRDVTQLIVDSYYNLAVRDLQRADALKAADNLEEALNLQQDDEVLRRHYQFAQTYQERPKDLLYKIYVKYLPFR
jgi:tetratricopeptide (TPR) repeat protein